MFILSSISSNLEFWLVNHTWIYQNSESNVFKNIKFLDEILIINQMIYQKQMYTRLLKLVGNC